MIETPRGKLVVVGQGYVGLPLAIRAVEVGWDVVGLDVDRTRVRRLRNGDSYVEDAPSEHVSTALSTGRYRPSTDYANSAGFDVVVITVPTPLSEGVPDLTAIEDSCRALSPQLTRGATVVLESTTYPGTTEELVAPLLEAGSGLQAGKDFYLGYSPERIDPGNKTWTLITTPKIVSGINSESLLAVQGFFNTLVHTTVPVGSPREAELAKLLENTFRHVNIALVNELAVFAHGLEIDIWQSIDAASTKPFGFMRFVPGPGVGGHCLPIDPSYLSWRVLRTLGQSFRFVELANDINDHMPDYVVRRIVDLLNTLRLPVNKTRILVLGLAYKKNTSDARESPALRVAELLLNMGADLHVADPHVDPDYILPSSALRVDCTASEIDAAELVIVMTDHDAFDFRLVAESTTPLLDCRGVPELNRATRL